MIAGTRCAPCSVHRMKIPSYNLLKTSSASKECTCSNCFQNYSTKKLLLPHKRWDQNGPGRRTPRPNLVPEVKVRNSITSRFILWRYIDPSPKRILPSKRRNLVTHQLFTTGKKNDKYFRTKPSSFLRVVYDEKNYRATARFFIPHLLHGWMLHKYILGDLLL